MKDRRIAEPLYWGSGFSSNTRATFLLLLLAASVPAAESPNVKHQITQNTVRTGELCLHISAVIDRRRSVLVMPLYWQHYTGRFT